MEKQTFTAEEIVRFFEERNIEPDSTFCAAAGQDWGFVSAWELPNNRGYIIRYGNNGGTASIFSASADLSEWLLDDDLYGIYRLIEQAQILGIDEVADADDEDKGPFGILVSRDYYGGISITTGLIGEYTGDYLEFDTIEEAQEWIDDKEEGIYHLSHNESGRPTYKIVAA